ncbi:MAG: citrate transporter [Clostridia bacterium]|nr:citrate transporter [Clostridia bacterium]
MTSVKNFLKNEIVLIISFILAVISAFIVHPDSGYIDYIDFRTLALLFCLMAVMAGFNKLGIFRMLASKLLSFAKNSRSLCLILSLLCFFSSMVITNDVALITFVPFSIIILTLSNKPHLLIPLVTFETVSANLGSMLTPIGNPQNLFLFSSFEMKTADFFRVLLPYALLSLILTVISAFFMKKERLEFAPETDTGKTNIKLCIVYSVLFVASLLTVFRVIPYIITFVVSAAAILIFDRKTLAKIDYSLLLTFTFLFIFIGNLKNITPVSEFLRSIVSGNEALVGVAASQIFSNVPAAILLSGFTENVTDLLIGVNLGGLGTLIASMASLISFKYVVKEKVSAGKYMLVFTVVNLIFLAFNLVLWAIIK